MTFRELINHVMNRGNLSKCINYIRSVDSDINDKHIDTLFNRYTNTVRELIELPGSDTYTGHTLCIESLIDDDHETSRMYMTDGKDKWAIDFIDWNDLIDLPIKDAISTEVSEMLGRVLYEITWWGFTRSSVLQQGQELSNIDKDNLIEIDLDTFIEGLSGLS